MHNSNTKGHTRTFYLLNNQRYLFSSLEQYVRYNREWWIQTCITITLRYVILCVLTLVTRKLKVVCGHSTYRMTPLLSKMSTFCVKAGCGIRMASYASRHASQSLSDKPFLRIQCLKTSGHTWMFSISNNCYIIGDILCVV